MLSRNCASAVVRPMGDVHVGYPCGEVESVPHCWERAFKRWKDQIQYKSAVCAERASHGNDKESLPCFTYSLAKIVFA